MRRLMIVLSLPAVVAAAQEPPRGVDLVRVADGVFAAIRREPLGLAVQSNSLIVVGDSGVLVVDAQFTRAATRETIREIRRLTPLPVRWVVNTHWHDDHFAGNQVYRDSFPGVQFIIHEHTRADLRTLGAPNREGTRTGAPPLADRYERQLALGLGIDSTPLVPGERESMTSAIRIIREYLGELPDFRETLEGPSVRNELRIALGVHDVRVRWIGPANTRGDLVVYLPRSGVVATGDVVVAPIPFAFGSYPAEWTAVLDSLIALRPVALVPGHGAVMRDLSYVRTLRTALGAVADSAVTVVARGDSTAVALGRMDFSAHREAFTRGDPWRANLFGRFFLTPAFRSAVQRERERRAAAPAR